MSASTLVTDAVQDAGRLAALRDAGLLDTAPEEVFDRFTRLARELLDVDVSLVSLVDHDRQFFKSQAGLPEPWAGARQTPLSHSFCQRVVRTGQPLVVSDPKEDSRVAGNGAVRDLGVTGYAGVPLTLAGGQTLGAFCVITGEPHSWTDREMRTLHAARTRGSQRREPRASWRSAISSSRLGTSSTFWCRTRLVAA